MLGNATRSLTYFYTNETILITRLCTIVIPIRIVLFTK